MNYLFYILYVDYVESSRKYSEVIKENIRFSVFSILTFYIVLLTLIPVFIVGRHFFPELSGIPLRVALFIAIFGTGLGSYGLLGKYYSSAKIGEITKKYADAISIKKAKIIYWVLLLSMPTICISWVLSVPSS